MIGYGDGSTQATATHIYFYTGATKASSPSIKMSILNDGNVGVNTADPTTYQYGCQGITVYNANYPCLSLTNQSRAWLWYGAGTELFLYERNLVSGTGHTNRLQIGTGGTLKIISANGNNLIQLREGSDAYGSNIRLDSSTGDTCIDRVVNNTATEALRVQRSTGYFGIGATSPLALCHVAGANYASGGGYATRGNLHVQSTDAYAIDTGGSITFGGVSDNTGSIYTYAAIHGKKETATNGSALGYLSFCTDNNNNLIERMRISSGGGVGVGMDASLASSAIKLAVKANSAVGTGRNTEWYNSNGSCRAYICDNGDSGFGANAGQFFEDGHVLLCYGANKNTGFCLTASGDIYLPYVYGVTTGSSANVYIDTDGRLFRSTSSLKYKEDVKDLSDKSALMLQARPVSFKDKNSKHAHIGFVAEELDALGLTELVGYDAEGQPDSVNYDRMACYLLQIIKSQNNRLEKIEMKKAA